MNFKKIYISLWYKIFKGSILNLSLTILLLLLGTISVILVFQNWDNILISIPGAISHDDYNELTDKKNILIEENSLLLSMNEEKEIELSKLEYDEYSEKADIYNDIIINLQSVIENLELMIKYGDNFKTMQLPFSVDRYTSLSMELDELRLEAADLSLSITDARKDLNDLNFKRDTFDNCLNQVDWDGNDTEIEEGIRTCVLQIDDIKDYVLSLEEKHRISLDDMTEYFSVLEEQWTASADYYESLSDGKYSEANKYDSIFVEKRKIIEEMDLASILSAFSNAVINPKVEIFSVVSIEISEKQDEVDKWYEEKIQK